MSVNQLIPGNIRNQGGATNMQTQQLTVYYPDGKIRTWTLELSAVTSSTEQHIMFHDEHTGEDILISGMPYIIRRPVDKAGTP